MGFRSLVSFGLVALPIGATLGLLLGLDAVRVANGQQRLFVDNSVTVQKYCQKLYGVVPPSAGLSYTLNPNQWGLVPGQDGHLCLKVHQWNNGTYPTPYSAPEFSVTWNYPPKSVDQPVHAFPNINLNPDGNVFPVKLSQLNNLFISTKWTYGMGPKPVKRTHVNSMVNKGGVATNVAIDMFLAPDKTSSESTQTAKYEVMVWLAQIGEAAQPLGYNSKAPNNGAVTSLPVVSTNMNLDPTTFSLYVGRNRFKQTVLTWVADTPTEHFEADIAPLITGLQQLDINAPGPDDYFGYIGMGSEAYFTGGDDVTFEVSELSINVK